jgi:hypothetical protein
MNRKDAKSARNPIFTWLSQRAPETIIGLVLLGLLVTVLYDLVVRPTLSTAARALLTVATLGSSAIRDSVYESASLDPTPVTPLLLLLSLFGVATFPVVDIFLSRLPVSRLSRERKRLEDLLKGATDQDKPAVLRQLDPIRARVRRRRLLFEVFALLGAFAVFVAVMVHNQSIVVWRSYHADLEVLRPHLTDAQYYKYRARFAGMRTREDFLLLRDDMKKVAAGKGARLREIAIW